MKQSDIFNNAKWVCANPDPVSVLAKKKFVCTDIKKAELYIVGLGYFEAYINGKSITDKKFLPLFTDFHSRKILINGEDWGEKTATRIYVCRFDVSSFLENGENVLGVMLGNGWYKRKKHSYGDKKLIFRLELTYADGKTEDIVSDESVLWTSGFVTEYDFTSRQTQDFNGYDETRLLPGDDDSGFVNVETTGIPDTEYLFSDCPADVVSEVIKPVIIRSDIGKRTYDIGKNCSGIAVLRLLGKKDDDVLLTLSEEKNEDNSISENHTWEQKTLFVSDGKQREVYPRFTWNNGRYIEISGKAELLRFEVIHTDVEVNSYFNSSSENLNWLYEAFVNTQLCNMHSGIPSDCPHIERRGYTGDGELACDAVMEITDCEKFYRKWTEDIADCQDRISGHVQYTAPYVQSGGGPGGWGCAIVHVPFMFFKHFGKPELMKKLYPQMKEYFRYLDDHSENGLVVSDRKGEWCLGDWCTARAPRRKILIPEPFVNTYFYIKSIDEVIECADVIGVDSEDKKYLQNKKAALVKAVNEAYFDEKTGDYAGNVQGSNAFAVDLKLGDERTLKNCVDFYKELGMYDTGIFGTDILTRVLFENGYPELAFELLSNQKMFSFGNLRLRGATTLWEYWTGRRSHSHPMFGAVTAYLFRYILGIRTNENGLEKIEPLYVGKDAEFDGFMTVAGEKVSVSIKYGGKKAVFTINSPCDTVFCFNGKEQKISKGQNIIERK